MLIAPGAPPATTRDGIGRQDGSEMGDEGQEGAEQQQTYEQPSYEQPQSYEQPPQSYEQAGPSDQAQTGATAGDGSDGSGQATGLSEDLFNQLGTLYNQGRYQEAIDRLKPLVDNDNGSSGDLYGRALYGLVMCLEQPAVSNFPDAGRYMDKLLEIMDTSHPNYALYVQQRDGYRDGHAWTGDPLLY